MRTVHAEPAPALRHSLVLLMAFACGLSAANLYYAQPILDTLAHAFGTGSGATGLVVTAAQVGYALGLALLVPLGDLLPRRRLAPAVLGLTTLGLICSALAPDLGFLIAVALLIGAGSVAAQIIVPLAASLAEPEERGKVVGTVMSGLLLGILLARTLSGLVAGAWGWRSVYVVAAILVAVMATVLTRALPDESERPRLRYRELLATAANLLVRDRLLERRALFGALAFSTFSLFWTTMAYLLSSSPFHYSDTVIGLFGLVGAGGALCATFAGRLSDAGHAHRTTLLFGVLIAASFALMWAGRHSVWPLIVGIVILDVGVQGMQVTNQSIIYQAPGELRSRVNSAYMFVYFAGGAIGSALGGVFYDRWHWAGVCVAGAAIGVASVLLALGDVIRPRQRTIGSST